jgi:hypothetical protein
MKKLFFFFLWSWLGLSQLLTAQTEQVLNNVGFGVAFIPSMAKGIYFNDPWDFWPNREPSFMYQANYSRQLNQSFRTGLYMEYERICFTTQQNDSVHSFRRYNLGIEWIGQFPATPLHLQLGGYFGYGFLMAQHWDKLSGSDLGIIAGPAYEKKHFGVSAQVRSGFAPYKSSGTPSGVLLFNPKLLFKTYYRF